MPNLKVIYQNLDLIFIILFFISTLLLLWVPPRWDEWIYLTFDYFPLNPAGSWVPHPPLLWYLLAIFYPIPRMAVLFCSSACLIFLFYACKRLYGAEIAGLAVAVLATNWLYLILGSLVMFTDGPVTAFMTMSTISFLCWLKLDERKFLLISGLGLALASLTKYTAAPIILATAFVWSIVLRKSLGWAKVLKMLGVAAVSLLPLAYWIYLLYQNSGIFVGDYSSLYNLFPYTNLSVFAYNIGYYAGCVLLIANLALIPILWRHQFDLDSKMLLVYVAVVFLFFVVISKQDIGNFRYILPAAPSLAIISAKNLVKEKDWVRLLMLLLQFVSAFILAYLALVMYLFK